MPITTPDDTDEATNQVEVQFDASRAVPQMAPETELYGIALSTASMQQGQQVMTSASTTRSALAATMSIASPTHYLRHVRSAPRARGAQPTNAQRLRPGYGRQGRRLRRHAPLLISLKLPLLIGL